MGSFSLHEEKNGNLWGATCSLALCISRDYKVKRGMPLIFSWRFESFLPAVRVNIGQVGIQSLRRGENVIYSLVTKEEEHDPSTYEALEAALKAMRRHMEENDIHELAMPRLACGKVDNLAWNNVKALICEVFKDASDIKITVYSPPFKRRLCSCCRATKRKPDVCHG